MSVRHDIVHTTVYRYGEDVRFGLQRVMFRPRDSHDQRVLATDLVVSPPASVRMVQDTYSNSIALVQPLGAARELRIVCSFTIEHVPGAETAPPLLHSAEFLPLSYEPAERLDLEACMRPHHEDPEGRLMAWVRQFMDTDGPTSTVAVLARMNGHIAAQLRYQARDEEGTQTPLQTLERGGGSCRDFALLMIEAARRLGMAARFVTGYLYDASLDGGHGAATDAVMGAGTTHAWLQVYLPGAGWVTYDPTNNLVGGSQLIRVAVARDPAQAAPISGVWYGEPEAYLGMEVSVSVRRRGGASAPLAAAQRVSPQ